MQKIVVIIPNRVKSAPNDIAVSQVLKLREIGRQVDIFCMRNKGNDYDIPGLIIAPLFSGAGALLFGRGNVFILHMFLSSLLAFFVRKSVCYVHSDIEPDCLDQFGAIKGSVVHKLWQFALRRSSKVVVVSRYLRERSHLARYLKQDHMVLVPTTTQHESVYDLANSHPIESLETRVQEFRSKHDTVLVVVGSFRRLKNQQLAIDICTNAQQKGMSLGVIFFGSGDCMVEVVQKSIRQNVGSHCLFLGQVAYPHLYTEESDIFLSTSLSEGFPLSFIEARDRNLRVLALDIKNLWESPPFVELFEDSQNCVAMIKDGAHSRDFPAEYTLAEACEILVSSFEGGYESVS